MARALKEFEAGLREKVIKPAAEMAKLMELMLKYGTQVVGQALEVAAVECIAQKILTSNEIPAPLNLEDHPNIPKIPAFGVDLQAYDILLGRK